MTTIYDIKVEDTDGQDILLTKYQGDILLIVNTATKCGLSPQYEGLQNLYEKFRAQGFQVLDFPSNQFLQTPHSNEEIEEFCQMNYQTTFPRFNKVNVNGDEAAPIYKYLKEQTSGILGSAIKWNFTKFLVDQNGKIVKRYAPTVTPEDIEKDILNLL